MNVSMISKIASEIVAGMMVLDPTRQQSRTILKALRSYYGIDIVQDPPYREYITKRVPEENANKFHYFVVFPKGEDNFVAANAWGRIGYPKVRVTPLGEFSTKQQAINVAENKMNRKVSEGYEDTPLA